MRWSCVFLLHVQATGQIDVSTKGGCGLLAEEQATARLFHENSVSSVVFELFRVKNESDRLGS